MQLHLLWSKVKSYMYAYIYMLKRNRICLESAVLFFTFQGEYTCNPKYICEELHELDSAIKCIWVTLPGRVSKKFPEYINTVEFGTPEYYKALYSAKIWVDNAFNIVKRPVKKKKKQYLIETGHGSLGIKRIGPGLSKEASRRDRKAFFSATMTDYIISNSSFETNVYRTSFWKETTLLELGHARTDILLNTNLEKIYNEKVRNFYNLDKSAKLMLYAPTFQRENSGDYQLLDFNEMKAVLEDRFGGTWYILNRLHPRDVRERTNNRSDSMYVLDGNEYLDIQELMVAVDVGITDYSSWIYDYVLMKKPGFIYAPDQESYEKNSEGFYYPITSTPFPVAKNNSEMMEYIRCFSEDEYKNDAENFIKSKGCVDDGTASYKGAEVILNLLADKIDDN